MYGLVCTSYPPIYPLHARMYSMYGLVCTIGHTSRATFGIPAKRLNITIYPLLGESLL